jgi:hypothetical protein
VGSQDFLLGYCWSEQAVPSAAAAYYWRSDCEHVGWNMQDVAK